MKRKSFLQTSAAALAGSFLPAVSWGSDNPKRPLRFAHLTDIHLKPGLVPEAGMAKAFQHAQSLKPGIEFIINGGDSIMDSLEADKVKTQTQWDLFHRILKNENQSPIYHTIGNHDVWGWFIKNNRPETDPLYGKKWVVDTLQLSNRYYSFTRGKWHFIVLDSVQLNPAGGYIGRLDEEQMDWLKQELASVPTGRFICLVSHIPVLSICAGLFFDKTEANGDLLIKRNLMHTDFLALKKLFIQYPAIKVCISGHIHLQDELEFLGVKYYCDGAVCGDWWGGPFQDFAPAYAVFDFYDDGTTRRQIMSYS